MLNKGLFNLEYQVPIIIYSTLISMIISCISPFIKTKAIIVNYHFSLNELEEFDLDKVLNQAIKDKNTI